MSREIFPKFFEHGEKELKPTPEELKRAREKMTKETEKFLEQPLAPEQRKQIEMIKKTKKQYEAVKKYGPHAEETEKKAEAEGTASLVKVIEEKQKRKWARGFRAYEKKPFRGHKPVKKWKRSL